MNKTAKVILTVLTVIAGLVFFALFVDMMGSFKYANRETEDPAESRMRVFEYKLRHKAYGEIMGTYYSLRLSDMEAQPGMEDIYNVAEYAHAAFMSRVYTEKGDESAVRSNAVKMDELKGSLGEYKYTADEIDEMIRNAP
ncbi:MAG: hypothetical protein J6X66_09135 [Lachnospiraceae bacterium]|nr:hypothetical protein [Lachnospiraceae bacterium]